MLFDGLKYRPAIIAILGITGEPEGNEKGFNSFWAAVQVESFMSERRNRKKTYRRIYRASKGGGALGLVIHKQVNVQLE